MAAENLEGAIRAHGIPVDPVALEAALADSESGPAFEEWAKTRLTADTLLSADELSMYVGFLQRSCDGSL